MESQNNGTREKFNRAIRADVQIVISIVILVAAIVFPFAVWGQKVNSLEIEFNQTEVKYEKILEELSDIKIQQAVIIERVENLQKSL